MKLNRSRTSRSTCSRQAAGSAYLSLSERAGLSRRSPTQPEVRGNQTSKLPEMPDSLHGFIQTPSDPCQDRKNVTCEFRVIAFLTEDGRVFEQAEIEQRFSKTATEMGAAALIMLPPARKIAAPEGWSSFDTFRYCAAVLAAR